MLVAIMQNLLAAPCSAQQVESNQIPVYSDPTGFGILQPTPGGLPVYGYSSDNSNWNISQWNNNQPISPFVLTGPQEWTATSASARVEATFLNGAFTEALFQSGGDIPCTTSAGQLNEFDLFVSPNMAKSTESQPSAALTYTDPSEAAILNLGNMSALTDSGTFQVTDIWQPPTTFSCAVNQGAAIVSVVLWDVQVTPHQVFFYELTLGGGCGPKLDPESCKGPAKTYTPTFWNSGTPIKNAAGQVVQVYYGIADYLPEYGYAQITDTAPHELTLQMLPRFTAIIEKGSFGMDTNIAHWTLGGAYYGQLIWGDTGLSSQWSGFIPMITPAPGVLAACGNNPSGSTYPVQISQTKGTIPATAAQCPSGGTQPTQTTVTQTYLCMNGTQTAQGSPTSTVVKVGNPTCNSAPTPVEMITPGQGSLTDCSGNIWTISAAGAVMEGKALTPGGGGTSHLAIVNCAIYGEDAHSGAWFKLTNGQWMSSAAPANVNPPSPPPPPTPSLQTITPGQGSLTDCSGNIWTISAAGAIIEGKALTPGGGGTSHLAIVNCTIYGEDAHSGAWFKLVNGQWMSSTAPHNAN